MPCIQRLHFKLGQLLLSTVLITILKLYYFSNELVCRRIRVLYAYGRYCVG
jgi:hypothetical protein